jgi:perosamine synthetase
MKSIPIMKPYFTQDEEEGVKQALLSGWVAQGPRVAQFEQMVAAAENAAYGIAVTSCTTALHLALVAMGVTVGMDILVPSFTFVATANAVEYTGARAILLDVTTDTYTLRTDTLEQFIKEHYRKSDNGWFSLDNGNRLFGIIPVHLFGLCADIHTVNIIAKKYDMRVLEDSACALGAKINGVHQGSFGNPSCLSFHPRKSITTGEGGMVLTNDDDFAQKLYQLRSHAASVSEIKRHAGKGFLMPEYNVIGYNYRMTDIQAAVGIAQMKKLDYIVSRRCELAARYNRILSCTVDFLSTPTVPEGYFHAYQSYVCMIKPEALGIETVDKGYEWRNELMNLLEQNGIATRQGTHAVHTLGYYRDKYGYHSNDLPGAYACDHLSIAIPLYVQMTEDEQDYVIEQLFKLSKQIKIKKG